MMDKQFILFDLDGTLTDPMIGITKSVQYALNHYGITENSLEKLTPFIGPPLKDSFMKYYGFPEDQARDAIQVYREYFAVKGIFENEVLPGIPEMLGNLKRNGRTLLVATSKPELFARKILEHFELASFFDFVGGADMEETRVKKGDVIRYTAGHVPGFVRERAVMIGDREHDIQGAKECGIQSIGVLMGYGSRQELEDAGADFIVRDAKELEKLLIIPSGSR